MKGIEIVSWVLVAAGFFGVVLNIKQNKWCWLLWGVTNTGLATVNFILGSSSQGVYFIICFFSCIWGYRAWRKSERRRKEQEIQDSVYTDWSDL
jgi:steroid 5-alpha reductase family enzyme